MTVVPMRPRDRITLNADGTLSGRARDIAFARDAEHFAVLAHADAGISVALVAKADVRVNAGKSLSGEPVGEVTFDRCLPVAVDPAELDQSALMQMGAVARALQSAGALDAILAMSVKYAGERVAFEKTISKFQAVQHNLARLAGEASAAMTAATSAADAIANASTFDEGVYLEAASARIRSAEAASEGSAIAHQVHGAIGYTKEHILHRFTMRLLTWRDDFGNESQWAVDLGTRIAKAGADELWPLIASR
jgi:acyl-CoA dehydrogenase